MKSIPQLVNCVLQKKTHFLLHSALRWSLIGSKGCRDVYGYNLIVSYAGEGGRYFRVEGEEIMTLLPPPPFGAALPGQTPERKVGPQSH